MKIIYITLALLGGAMLLVILAAATVGIMATGKTGRRGKEGQLKNAQL